MFAYAAGAIKYGCWLDLSFLAYAACVLFVVDLLTNFIYVLCWRALFYLYIVVLNFIIFFFLCWRALFYYSVVLTFLAMFAYAAGAIKDGG